jgi:hypothetical protein
LTRLTGRSSTSDFLLPDHPSGAFPLSVAITRAFSDQARRRNAHALILMLPGGSNFRERAVYGKSEYDQFARALMDAGVDVVDLAPLLLKALGSRTYCDLYTDQSICDGHYSKFGNSLVAKIVANELMHRGAIH